MEKVGQWISSSVTLKLVVITILMLLLLIPGSMIRSVIQERENLNQMATAEVSAKWAGSQQINGPILSIPLLLQSEQEGQNANYTEYLNQLPDQLNIEATIEPERLKRGIYEVVVYKSTLRISGSFVLNLEPNVNNLLGVWKNQAFLTVGISDLRGIKDQIDLRWSDQNIKAEPGSRLPQLVHSGVTFDLPDLNGLEGQTINFDFTLNLQGSQNMSFIPLGNTTHVQVASNWDAPSFNGNFLPDNRQVTENGFTANWKVLQLNRNFPQHWIGAGQQQQLGEAAFGVDLLLPLDDYQKSMRSVKYMVMTIALTFLIFFLVEVLNKKRIHPFQYILVGLALCLFYVLLISISEHTDFDLAYLISMLGIVGMIGLYSVKVFKKPKLSLLLFIILAGTYGFLYVTLQLSDYALLMGSIGLTLMLGATMYFTRNIDWYKLNIEPNE